MKFRAALLLVFMLSIVVKQVNATCQDGVLAYGDSCASDYQPEQGRIRDNFSTTQGDIINIALSWDSSTTGHLRLDGPVSESDDAPPPFVEIQLDGESELTLAEVLIPESGMYAISVFFGERATYEVSLWSGDVPRGESSEPVASDYSFLGDTRLVYAVSLYAGGAGEYFYGLNSLTLAEGDTELIDTDNRQFSNGCGVLSPDGSRLTFRSTRAVNGASSFIHNEIYIADTNDTARQSRLTFTTVDEEEPRWSPDGQRITYMLTPDISDRNSFEIYVINADGSNMQQITDNDFSDRFPAWSPDGARIVFHSNRDGENEIYTMRPDGSDVQQLTYNDVLDEGRARYSPDGTRIAFNAGDPQDLYDIYVMDADGQNIQNLTNTPDIHEFGAEWSPDGTQIAYSVTPDSLITPGEVWVMNADGSGAFPLLADPELDYIVCNWGIVSDQ